MPRPPKRSAKPNDVLARAGKLSPVAARRGRGRHSTLFVWMREHHERLAAAFADNSPDWTALSVALGEAGLTDADGKQPTAEGARQTWWRVRKALEAARSKAKRKRAAPASNPASTATSPTPVPCEPWRPEDEKPATQENVEVANKIMSAYASIRARQIPMPDRINPNKPKDR